MEELYAALLLHSSKQEISEENVKKVLSAAGASIDEARVKVLVTALSSINIDEVLKQATLAPAPVAAQPAPAAPAAPVEKKEEKEKKEEEAEAAAGLAALFG